jgi:hypothetical protein
MPTLLSAAQKPAKAQPASEHETASTQQQASRSNENNQALQADLNRMRVLLRQMQNNMGAATSAQDPLKHQFELEIEMWQIVIKDMERKLQPANAQ